MISFLKISQICEQKNTYFYFLTKKDRETIRIIIFDPLHNKTMKISYNWLKQFLKTNRPAKETGELLTDLGLEIEGIESYQSVKGGLEGIVVGEVLTCIQHPNADRLKITTVNIGTDNTLQIVCGAPNVAAGQKVPVATIGTTLYTETGEAWKTIKICTL